MINLGHRLSAIRNHTTDGWTISKRFSNQPFENFLETRAAVEVAGFSSVSALKAVENILSGWVVCMLPHLPEVLARGQAGFYFLGHHKAGVINSEKVFSSE